MASIMQRDFADQQKDLAIERQAFPLFCHSEILLKILIVNFG
jgi:hypothetical protein